MRRLYSFLIIVAIIVLSVGFLRGWLSLTGGREAVTHKIDVNLKVDTDKVKEDVAAMEDKAAELTGKAKASVTDLSHRANETATPKKE